MWSLIMQSQSGEQNEKILNQSSDRSRTTSCTVAQVTIKRLRFSRLRKDPELRHRTDAPTNLYADREIE